MFKVKWPRLSIVYESGGDFQPEVAARIQANQWNSVDTQAHVNA